MRRRMRTAECRKAYATYRPPSIGHCRDDQSGADELLARLEFRAFISWNRLVSTAGRDLLIHFDEQHDPFSRSGCPDLPQRERGTRTESPHLYARRRANPSEALRGLPPARPV